MQTSVLSTVSTSNRNPLIENPITGYRLQTFEQSIPQSNQSRRSYDHYPRDTKEQALARAIRETG